MAKTILVDTGFLVALLNCRDSLHLWAKAQAPRYAPPWLSCEAVLSETVHLLGTPGAPALSALLRRKALLPAFNIASDLDPVLKLMQKYADLPISLADACLVHMTETLPDPLLLTTDSDFRFYRRRNRQTIPCVLSI